MYAQALSYATCGIGAIPITIEADIKGGLYKFSIVGLPSNSIKESRDRISAAIANSGFKFPAHNYTINLAPADIRKEGVAFDLPSALALLSASRQIDTDDLTAFATVGELALDGSVRPIKGILPVAAAAAAHNVKALLVPAANAAEAAVVEGINVYPVKSLAQAAAFVSGDIALTPYVNNAADLFTPATDALVDMFDVKGQLHAKRALEVAAAGAHNVLMSGPPGSGKTMLARRLPTILPPLTFNEALQTTKIHSVAGQLETGQGLVKTRPFRSPHHTVSNVALVGGGIYPRPGEVSLAHNGVLFLDELPEFGKTVLEVMRQPLEDGQVTISRANQSLQFPARFMLVASMNPCPCGWWGTQVKGHTCNCAMSAIVRYRSRISGPLLDRVDIQIEVPALPIEDLARYPQGENSSTIRNRVMTARKIQQERYKGTGFYANSHLTPSLLRRWCKPDEAGAKLLATAIDKLGLSARAYDRILKVARTIADLEATPQINSGHISEAIGYRSLDRDIWA